MTSGASVWFWQPAAEVTTELVCADLEAREVPLHVHEEWQFGVLDTPSKLSLGAFRRFPAHPDDVTIVHPYEVHGEGGELGARPRWRMLYVMPAIVSRLYGGGAPHFRRPVVTDPVAAAELRDLLRRSGDGSIAGPEFLRLIAHWLEQFLLRRNACRRSSGPARTSRIAQLSRSPCRRSGPSRVSPSPTWCVRSPGPWASLPGVITRRCVSPALGGCWPRGSQPPGWRTNAVSPISRT